MLHRPRLGQTFLNDISSGECELFHLKCEELVHSGFIENRSRLIGFSVNMEGHMGQE
jgi:hypothetical protein